MRHSTGKPTKAESDRITRMKTFGCLPCASAGYLWGPQSRLEVHHILRGNKRLGHWWTIILCRGHHRGRWSAEQLSIPTLKCVAISDGRKAFAAAHGTEMELWTKTQHLLNLDDSPPTTKILPRRIGGDHVPPTARRDPLLASAVPVAPVSAGGAADGDQIGDGS